MKYQPLNWTFYFVDESYTQPKAGSYAPCACGAHCVMLGRYPDQPCWGQVEVGDIETTDDEDIYVHACQGHLHVLDRKAYVTEP